MKPWILWPIWGVFTIICAGLGFIPDPEGFPRLCMLGLSLLFFVPPAILMTQARQNNDTRCLRRLRILCAASLLATLLLLIANILSAFAGDALGDFLYVLLGLCSVPMLCSTYWVVPLFLWSVLLISSLKKTGTDKQNQDGRN